MRAGAPLTIGEACLKIIMSSFLVLREGDTRNRWREGQVCPDGALDQTARVCFGVLCANRTREAERDFCDLPIRRGEGRVLNTPLVFKRVLFEETGEKREKTWRFGGCGVEAPGSDKRLFYGGCWCDLLAAIRIFLGERL
ncbi:hypothetical protein TNCV_1933181 [Trichonephila clavipes]|nr:hypothetical protein TNCV_1933181 [Trichonephila clavipes]